MQILDNYRLEIFNELNEKFPDKAENIINLAENYCNKEKDFFNLNDDQKAEKVITTIFDNSDIFGEDLVVFLKINKYISLFENNFIEKINESGKLLQRSPFFSDNLTIKKNFESIENLNTISNDLEKLKKECIEALLEINIEIKNQISLLKESSKLNINDDNNSLKKSLNNIHIRSLETQGTLFDIYNEYLTKTISINKQLVKFNELNEISKFDEKLKVIELELDKILCEQDKVLKKVSDFQLLPVEQLLIFPNFIESFSSLILAYSIIKTVLISLEQQIYLPSEKDLKLSRIKVIEQNFLDNFKVFINLSVKAFDRGLPLVNDKNKTFKNKFIEPIKSKFDNESLEIINLLIDTVY